MNYKNVDMKLDQFIAYVNDDKINLIPPFQRGHVWNLSTRRKLIQNVVQSRPIPAIFLYREKSGDKYAYNILDGKQRLESLILFVGNQRHSLEVKHLHKFFYEQKTRAAANFQIEIDGKKQGIKDLSDDLFRDLQEYIIPTIEITLSDEHPSALNEMISLFVDINSYGVQVKRFDIVKAMSKDKLLKSVFGLIAQKQTRGKDVLYKYKKNEFTKVLKTLQIVENLREANSKVDRMWELLVEIVLFLRTKKHRTPIEILKSFIKATDTGEPPLSSSEITELRKVFRFLASAYKNRTLLASRLSKNQIHFYTMITAIISEGLLGEFSKSRLIKKLASFGAIIDETGPVPTGLSRTIKSYRELSAKHTTHVGRRADRQDAFLKAIRAL